MPSLPIDRIAPDPDQPRKTFDKAGLRELADSIKEHGLLQPTLVEETDTGDYIIIAGERRWRAHEILGLENIDAIIRPRSNGDNPQERSILALVENLHRDDLNVKEQAEAFQRLIKLGLTFEEVSQRVGLAVPTIRNRIKILDFEPQIQDLFAAGKLPFDMRVYHAIKDLPEGSRLRLVTQFAERQASGRSIVNACKRITARTGKPKPHLKKVHVAKSGIPIIDYASSKHDTKIHDCYAKIVGRVCRRCVLYESADWNTCRDCPGLELAVALSKQGETQ